MHSKPQFPLIHSNGYQMQYFTLFPYGVTQGKSQLIESVGIMINMYLVPNSWHKVPKPVMTSPGTEK